MAVNGQLISGKKQQERNQEIMSKKYVHVSIHAYAVVSTGILSMITYLYRYSALTV